MILNYIETDSRDAAFHFSVEEYFLRHTDLSVVMVWRTDDCVMLGRNQLAPAEIDLEYARGQGMQIVRRSSGGGTIFTDCGTLLYTVIMPSPDGETPLLQAKKTAAMPVVCTLRKLSADANLEGRNDILIQGKKVSGIAQYAVDKRICTHGSLLFAADLDVLQRVLTPDKQKLLAKAVPSVRSRVTNAGEHTAAPCIDFFAAVRQGFFDYFSGSNHPQVQGIQRYSLSTAEMAIIEEIRKAKYSARAWTEGSGCLCDGALSITSSIADTTAGTIDKAEDKNEAINNIKQQFPLYCKKRFAAGGVEVFLRSESGTIGGILIRGDFLATDDISGLESLLFGTALSADALSKRLRGTDLSPYIGEVSPADLIECILQAHQN